MSGLVGYIGHKEAEPVLLDSLERLEYRGYDSAGLGVISDEKLKVYKTLGRPVNLREKLLMKRDSSQIGIGHTRWATHGKPLIKNAHPFVSGDIAVVHNGIVSNATKLKNKLEAEGVRFRSDTDSEVLPHMFKRHWKGSLLESVLSAVKELEDGITCCVISAEDPDYLIAIRKGNPLVVGLGEGEQIVASDATAVAPYTDQIIFMQDCEIAILSHEGAEFIDFDGKQIRKTPQKISWDLVRSEKRGYRHFLLKEITESPGAVRATIEESISVSSEKFSPSDFCFQDIGKPTRVIFCGSGSSFYAALIGRSLIESIGGVSTSSIVASEFRYGQGVVEKDALYVVISQSGESLDTMESAKFIIEEGAKLLAITNNAASSLARLADFHLLTQAGPEVSVVSSKTFSASISALTLLAYHIGATNGHLSKEEQELLLKELREIPEKMELTIMNETKIRRLALKYAMHHSFFFVGRGLLYPLTLYSALLMKEVANMHGEGLLAGEIKHGSVSLIEEGSPLMFFANQTFFKKQIIDDINELKTRGAAIIATAFEGSHDTAPDCDEIISVPNCDDRLSVLLAIAPAQLFIYYLGMYKRKDVDRPRNIAKSVTV